MIAAAALFVLVAVLLSVALFRDRSSPARTVTVTITADTSEFDRQMRQVKANIDEFARLLGERMLPPFRRFLARLTEWWDSLPTEVRAALVAEAERLELERLREADRPMYDAVMWRRS